MKKNKNCDTERVKLTYKPKGSKQNRKNMCPNKSSKKYCGTLRYTVLIRTASNMTDIYGNIASQDVDCDPSQPSKGCNPYAYLTKNKFWSMKNNPFKLTCDEFPFGEYSICKVHYLQEEHATDKSGPSKFCSRR